MRAFVLALAILLLLPLRGWLGDAMVAPAHEHAAHVHDDAHASHAADTSNAPRQATPAAHDCQGTGGAAGTCGTCQLCHSVAIGQPPIVPLLNAAPREAPAFRPAAFVSAEPSVGLKPPIS